MSSGKTVDWAKSMLGGEMGVGGAEDVLKEVVEETAVSERVSFDDGVTTGEGNERALGENSREDSSREGSTGGVSKEASELTID